MAKELCEGGAKVVMLEVGKEVRPSDLLSHKWPYELPFMNLRGENRPTFIKRSCREGEPVRGPDGFQGCAEIRLAQRVTTVQGRGRKIFLQRGPGARVSRRSKTPD